MTEKIVRGALSPDGFTIGTGLDTQGAMFIGVTFHFSIEPEFEKTYVFAPDHALLLLTQLAKELGKKIVDGERH